VSLGKAKAKPQLQGYNFTDWKVKGVHANIVDADNLKLRICEAKLVIQDGQLVWIRWADAGRSSSQIQAADKAIETMLSNRNIMTEVKISNARLIEDLEWHSLHGSVGEQGIATRKLPEARQMQILINNLLE
jgi:hypothetical protein